MSFPSHAPAFLGVPPAFAGGAGATNISGLLAPDTASACTEHADAPIPASVVSGSLAGCWCWYLDTLDVRKSTPSGILVATGTETLSGRLGRLCGHFHTT